MCVLGWSSWNSWWRSPRKKPKNNPKNHRERGRFKTKGQDTIKWLIYKIILIKWVKRKRHRTCILRKRARARLESAGSQQSLAFHPHRLPSDLPVPENQNNPIPGVQVAGHRLSNFLAANYTLWKSFSPGSRKILTTVCFKHCSWSRSFVRFWWNEE